jgi:hypothetical protein
LYFGAWNFHDLLKSQLLYLFQAIIYLNNVVLRVGWALVTDGGVV